MGRVALVQVLNLANRVMSAAFTYALLGVIAAGGAGVALYLGAPQQQLRRVPVAPRTSFVSVVGLGAIAVVLLRRVLGAAEAVYAALLVVTLMTTALPFLRAAFARSSRGMP